MEQLDEHPIGRRHSDYGDRKEITLASAVAAAALAWTLVSAFTGFRDDVYGHAHDLDLRLRDVEAFRQSHIEADVDWYARIVRAEQRIEGCLINQVSREDADELERRLRDVERRP